MVPDPELKGWLAYGSGRFAESVKQYAIAIGRDPKEQGLHADRARAFIPLLQYDSAAAEFAAQLAPNRADILYLYGVLLMTRRSFDAAEQFRLAIEADPYYVKPYFPLAGRLRPHGTP